MDLFDDADEVGSAGHATGGGGETKSSSETSELNFDTFLDLTERNLGACLWHRILDPSSGKRRVLTVAVAADVMFPYLELSCVMEHDDGSGAVLAQLKIDAECLSGHVRVRSWKAGCVRSCVSVVDRPLVKGERREGGVATTLTADPHH